MSKYEMEAFQIILHSGNARSSAYEAIASARNDDLGIANTKIEEARNEIVLAQKEHAKLLQRSTVENMEIDLLMMHAEDHVASSQVAVDLIQEMIRMYERFGDQHG
ncbi:MULTISPECIES: PTS lactose/cellobiose transporter subunit IIA [unclassified Breznakia]|uniref:PTS lactose/cellobiose transporter subunit IIA n=1 Tax=unclassified Breznakia TaxID=2623764 RepID=UPI0024760251|nr:MULTISPECIES: PTS lactose/cellobiose transporter subunit IIA [unclassified Breznakia]MDH6367006.1 PTS system cellobiose-specific IIA component [Breznakia sp. PH1-1]MDH6404222.1 PTS system cellobiose-specific IIA component [Breznakia sp. PF1-11]MDH6411893.1 PTS system cellobiose-specific IIA component [Breznakia sp. PFB1-11]MDH6414210.1 PTS system cellobiose-specific IIA component [Breznakia sp. PFB1-14]MDH6415966.1 PTS system cellobiose-specific IIA component [Breznakia sp. PFB1-4]